MNILSALDNQEQFQNLRLIVGVRTYENYVCRKTKKTKKPRDHSTKPKPWHEVTKERYITGLYIEVQAKAQCLESNLVHDIELVSFFANLNKFVLIFADDLCTARRLLETYFSRGKECSQLTLPAKIRLQTLWFNYKR